MATTFLLGVPGSEAGAMVLSALYLQGWVAGARLFLDHKEVMYGVLCVMVLEQFLIVLAGLAVIAAAYPLSRVRLSVIAPALVMAVCVGAYAYRQTVFDVGIAVLFGLLGYLLRKLDYPIIALVLGLMLGGMADERLIIMGQRFAGDYLVIFKRPISLALCILTVLSIGRSLYTDYKRGFLSLYSRRGDR